MTLRGKLLGDTLIIMPQGLKIKKYLYKIQNEQKTRILDSWLESADRPPRARNFQKIFAQEPSMTWKFDYSSKKNTLLYTNINHKS